MGEASAEVIRVVWDRLKADDADIVSRSEAAVLTKMVSLVPEVCEARGLFVPDKKPENTGIPKRCTAEKKLDIGAADHLLPWRYRYRMCRASRRRGPRCPRLSLLQEV